MKDTSIPVLQQSPNRQQDLHEITRLIKAGFTLSQIAKINPRYKRYRGNIKSEFYHWHLKEMPLLKKMHNEWHICKSDTAIELYTEWCNKHGRDFVYLCSDSKDHSFDRYILKGIPPIVFMKNFMGSIKYTHLLNMLDRYKCRLDFEYSYTYTLWNTCIITSTMPPEKVYRDTDPQYLTAPLLRRLDTITYHYKEDGIDKAFTMPAEDYRDFSDLKCRAKSCKGMKFYN